MDAAILHITLEAPPRQDLGPGLTCPECGCTECQVEPEEGSTMASCPDCQMQWSPEQNQVVPESLARRTVAGVIANREQRRLEEAKNELL